MTLSTSQTHAAIFYLQRVIPKGPQEQEELYGLITDLRSVAQTPVSLPMAPSHLSASLTSIGR